ncbi:hypothetical protein [Methanococcoides sp. AM1]|uniref:hypothetical protein n=1 Tax=Methanococcoides sp. AM1 TaxID=1201011 RepID=UPI001082ADD2|nr:hypothetical protein [Methanococcoides sp. AM1]
MLCTKSDYGVICTNKCSDFPTCEARRLPFLIHVTNVCCSIGDQGMEVSELYPEACVNGVVQIDC